ncbi:MAG: hypothetical protein ABIA56_05190 [Actinomycetota bacterium]
MKILIGDKEHVDFDEPIKMDDNQREKFIIFLKELFYEVKEEHMSEVRTERLGEKNFGLGWSDEERYQLLKVEDTETVSRKLGRTWMSIVTKRGAILPEFLLWLEDQGIDLAEITEELVKRYFEEIEKKKLVKKKKSQELSLIKRQIDSLMESECVVGTDEFGKECKDGFHEGCFVCPFSKKYIRSDEDIEKFNKVWRENFVEKEDKDEIDS